MVLRNILLKVTVVTDDDTGIYKVGELDFGITGYCESFLEKPGNREKFVKWLRWLADAAEGGTQPFFPYKDIVAQDAGVIGEEG